MKNDTLEEILVGALDRVGDDRAAFLERACGPDDELKSRVLELIEAHDSEPGVLEPDETGNGELMIGRRVGSFTIDRLLASGGMGNVYVATQDDPRREVALKLMRPGIASRSALRRFRFESQVLGRLHHPNIAQVFEAGAHDEGTGGVPYFAMEYVPDAKPITEFVGASDLSTRERLALLAKVCNAVHHGHQKGVIHRDLKPSNILIDASGEPKIIDFGVARTTDSDIAVTTMGTDLGQLVGTLAYMSPEQCAADPDDLDTRSDVYGLGVVLYELLCDQLPYDLSRVPFPEAARVIREEAPAKPSTVNRTLRGDVETIALKALEKDRERRYQSAADMGQDIDRYLRGEAIDARPPSTAYRMRTFARRHKVASTVLVMLLVAVPALATATVIAVRSADRAREAQESAESAQLEAEQITKIVIDALKASDPFQGGNQEILVADAMEQAIADLDAGALDGQPKIELVLRKTISEVLQHHTRFDQAVQQAERVLEITRTLHGSDHPDVADNLSFLAHRLDAADRPEDALAAWTACLEMRKRLSPGENMNVAGAMHNVGHGLSIVGRYDEAVAMLEATRAMKRRLISDRDHVTLAATMYSLALTLNLAGREAEGLPMATSALEMLQRLHEDAGAGSGRNLAGRLTLSMSLVGRCLYAQGRAEKALEMHEAAVETCARLLGDDHQLGEWSRFNVAVCLDALGRSEEALPRWRARLARFERRLHPGGSTDRPNHEGARFGLACCLLLLDEPEEALPHAQEALAINRRRVKQDTRHTAAYLTLVSSCLAALGRPADALPGFEEAMEINRRVLPPGHPDALQTQIGMARSLVSLGRHVDAERLLLDAAEHCSRSEAARRWHWPTLCGELVRLYDEWHALEPEREYDVSAAGWRRRRDNG